MKRLTPKKIEQLRHAVWHVLESDDLTDVERQHLELQVELLRNMYRRLTGKELV